MEDDMEMIEDDLEIMEDDMEIMENDLEIMEDDLESREDDQKCLEGQIKNLLGPALYRSCTSSIERGYLSLKISAAYHLPVQLALESRNSGLFLNMSMP
jgi:hypothetical protein